MPPRSKIDRDARRRAFESALVNASPDDPTPILSAAAAARVPRSSAYRYARLVETRKRDDDARPLTARHVALIERITEQWERSHRTAGAPKIHRAIRRTQRVGHNLVARLMTVAGIRGTYNVRKAPRARRNVAPDSVAGDWHAEGRRVLAADTMEFPCSDGRVYVAGQVDCDSRRTTVASAEKNDTRLTTASLREAVRTLQLDPGQSLTALSDQGPQYTAGAYVSTVERLGCARANTPVHTPTRNAIVEGTWSLFRREFPRFVARATGGQRIKQLSCRAARRLLGDYTRWFNDQRLHSALGYRSPAEFEALARDERRAILARWDRERAIAREERRREIEAHTAARAARVLASLACAPAIARAPLALAA